MKPARSQTATDVVVRLKSPWAPGHFYWSLNSLDGCGSTSLSSRVGTHQIRDQSHALKIEITVTTP